MSFITLFSLSFNFFSFSQGDVITLISSCQLSIYQVIFFILWFALCWKFCFTSWQTLLNCWILIYFSNAFAYACVHKVALSWAFIKSNSF
jgi:hypothetical protein